jgi:cystathionine gamma-synthase
MLIRGIKTLAVRMDRQQSNAQQIAEWLKAQKKIRQVYYVGLPEHPGYEINASQARGAGSMISFHTDSAATAKQILERVKLISFAESLGGVESLITYPMLQTHGDVPVEVRERLGITDCLLRLSVGIEKIDDLIEDLRQALEGEA